MEYLSIIVGIELFTIGWLVGIIIIKNQTIRDKNLEIDILYEERDKEREEYYLYENNTEPKESSKERNR